MKGIFGLLLSIAMLTGSSIAYSASKVNFADATPVGSWQEREETITNHKGKKSYRSHTMAVVGEELYMGKPYIWVEMRMQEFKIKKGKKSPKGDPTVMKALISREMFSAKPEYIYRNLPSLAQDMIVQNGKAAPLRVEKGGMIAKAFMKMTDINTDNLRFNIGDKRQVEVPAGKYNCRDVTSSNHTKTKFMFKKYDIKVDIVQCVDSSVPFGVVYASNQTITNGKKEISEMKMTRFGKSGAKSAITEEPMELPKLTDILSN